MRTRTKSSEYVLGDRGPMLVIAEQPPGTFQSSGIAPKISGVLLRYTEENMTDEPYRSISQRPKYVLHTKRHIERSQLDADTLDYNGTSPITRYVRTGPGSHWYAFGEYGTILHDAIQINWMDENAMIRKAVHDFYSHNIVDNLQNLVEAHQLVGGVRQVCGRIKELDSFLVTRTAGQVLHNIRGLLNLRAIRRGTLKVANDHLLYSFGVKPLLSDISTMTRTLGRFAKACDRSVRSGVFRFDTRARFGGTFNGFDVTKLDGSYGDPVTGGGYWHSSVQTMEQPEAHVFITGRDRNPYTTKFFRNLDKFVESYLGSGPVNLAWELVPWSFVVDWFVDLSAVIDKLDHALTGSSRVIDGGSVSYKWGCQCPVIHHARSDIPHSSADGQQTVLNELHYYTRKPIASFFSVGGSGRFGKRQGFLTASLLRQLVAKR